MPTVSMAASARCGSISIFTPSASSTSADPQRELNERLPCLATRTPAPATTSAAAVETLNVPPPSPPVPQVSTSGESCAWAFRMGHVPPHRPREPDQLLHRFAFGAQ